MRSPRLDRDARRELIRRRAVRRAQTEQYLVDIHDRRRRLRAGAPWLSISAQSRMDDAQILLADVDAGSWERRKS